MSVYYPIGTIVKVTLDEDMLFMISGYLATQNKGKAFDYMAVPFPLGLMRSNHYIIFNKECITEVVHVGYCDNECKSILDDFDKFVENIKDAVREIVENNNLLN